MRQSRLSLYILLSLLLHVLLLLIFASGLIRLPSSQADVDNGETTLTLLQETPLQPSAPAIQQASTKAQSTFIPTLPSQETDKPNPNALLESERNTALRTDAANPRNANSPLPDMTGDKRSNSWVNSPASSGQGQQPPAQASAASKQAQPSPQQSQSPQMTQAQQQPQPTPPKPTQPQQEQAQTPPQPAKPKPPTPRLDDAIPVLPPETPKPSQQVAQQSAQQSQQSPSAANSPQQASRPPPVSFAASRADISGSRGISGAPSPEARDTELGRYKQKMYRAVGSRWYLKTQSSMSFLAIGSVRIKFFVRANGVLENVRIVDDSGSGNNSTEMLRTISLQSLVESAPFEPFSETMKQQLGAGYDEEFTFSIY